MSKELFHAVIFCGQNRVQVPKITRDRVDVLLRCQEDGTVFVHEDGHFENYIRGDKMDFIQIMPQAEFDAEVQRMKTQQTLNPNLVR